MNIFYLTNVDATTTTLPPEESAHCMRVLRKKCGDTIYLVDGKGGFYNAKIVSEHSKKCEIEIIEHKIISPPRNYKIVLAVAPTKMMERYEWFVEKAVEIGIDEIVPLQCEHSERKNCNVERLNKIAIAALKQSMNLYLPNITEIKSFKEFVKQCNTESKYIAHCENAQQSLKQSYSKETNVTILIGPEGDFSKEEISYAIENGFEAVNLGKTRLRTETAAVVVCSIINLINS